MDSRATPAAAQQEVVQNSSWFLPVLIAFGTIIALAVLKKVLSGASTVLAAPRNKILLIGLAGAGKTVMFTRLCGNSNSSSISKIKTLSSIAANCGTSSVGGKAVVDFPGHQRLRHELFAELQKARRVIVVIDSVTINDDKTEGAKELSGLLLAALQSEAFFGVESVLFACTKRDEVTSYSAKAVRRILESEMTRAIVASTGAVGSLRGEVAKQVRKDATAKSSAAREECMLMLDENNKFSFNSLRVPFSFVDCSVEDFEPVESFIAQ